LDLERDKHISLLQKCADYIDTGKLKIHVSHILPLSEAKAAHDLIEIGHTIGKVVLSI
jgi:NADPH:quinone reductase